MQSHKLGRPLLAVLVLLSLSSCRNSVPPKIEVCIGDGVGGADCIEADGSKLFRPPSQLKNYWMTNQPDEANLLSWCFATTPSAVSSGMKLVREDIHSAK